MKPKLKINQEHTQFVEREEEDASYPMSSSSEHEPPRRARMEPRFQANSNDFRVKIPEFEGELDPDEFLEWTHMVERVFDYKDVPGDKKVKLVALRLRKYASLWWTKLFVNRVTCRKSKIRTWDKMKAKFKSRFLPPIYIQDSYLQFHALTQGGLNVEEYTIEFEKLMIKSDIKESEEKTIVRYLGGLDPNYANVVELQQYTTFDDVCVLSHKVE